MLLLEIAIELQAEASASTASPSLAREGQKGSSRAAENASGERFSFEISRISSPKLKIRLFFEA
jgi:hypothetical protein